LTDIENKKMLEKENAEINQEPGISEGNQEPISSETNNETLSGE